MPETTPFSEPSTLPFAFPPFDAEGRFWLTQARPITTLYPVPEGRGAAQRVGHRDAPQPRDRRG